MVRVLHYVGYMKRGGMETMIMNLYRAIDTTEVQFDFAVHGDEKGDFADEIIARGGAFYHFPHMRKNPAAYRKAWRAFWKKNGHMYTAFHMHTNSLANFIAFEEACRAGVPVRIIHSHSSYAAKGKLQLINNVLHALHQKKAKKMATHLFACSDKAAAWLFGGMTLGKLKVQIIKNGVDLAQFRYDEQRRQTLREALGLTGKKVIGHVGAFLPVKNHSFLVEVVEAAYRKDDAVRAVFVGDGPLFEQIREKINQKGLEDVILLLGLRSDVNELLSALDLFVMPSLYEGLPVSLVEVQANGLPALVSDSITRDVKFLDSFNYMALSDGPEAWGQCCIDLINADIRTNDVQPVADNGFDIKQTAEIYKNVLLNNG